MEKLKPTNIQNNKDFAMYMVSKGELQIIAYEIWMLSHGKETNIQITIPAGTFVMNRWWARGNA